MNFFIQKSDVANAAARRRQSHAIAQRDGNACLSGSNGIPAHSAFDFDDVLATAVEELMT